MAENNEKYTRELQEFYELIKVLKRLRAPDGCPWDREQTPQTIKKYMLEEAYELYEAIDNEEDQEVKEELGDLLFLLLFLADLYEEKGAFTLGDALLNIKEKMIRRHPHIFGDVKVNGSKDVVANWQAIKGKEQEEKGKKKSTLGNLPLALPALQRAFRLGERASRVGFDWDRAEDVFDKLREEISELEGALEAKDKAQIEDELGDILFTVANLSRKLDVNPEDALKKALGKFVKRFHRMEEQIENEGRDMSQMSIDELESYWQGVK
ncbi:MAG: nucleoside triphosphate pyrophosphohydrolase [Thermodesulfobacteria bacterium]|nr:nucleoside triphosphate pyrophosphohydrolase [Thermodesulfobacteriota bacterium]